ncbi:MAG: periplasmic polysaccharide biosynthesis/export protein [Desulfobacteraceae bacterium]|nr:periplasmic polysaccharide biosynthesis/export protein [Desulfobacteraceae bacterium]
MNHSCIKKILLLLLFLPVLVQAQEYTVGPGDILNIKVYENDDLSTRARVTDNYTIRVPLVGEIKVKDMTVSKVAIKIEELLSDGYLISPQVDVFISEYRSKKAIILGQISKPGQYELIGRITLLQFISKAGGLTGNAGSYAIIKRANGFKTKDGKHADRITLDLEKLIQQGDTSLNLVIQDNDSIYISKAKTYYVSGEVDKPNAYKYEPGITVIKAITTAGGFSQIAAKGKVQIIRILKTGEKVIYKNVAMDKPILPDDVIVVPESFF